MPDNEKQKQHAANVRAETHIMRDLGITRGQARQRLHDFRIEQEAARQAKAAIQQPATPPAPVPPKIETDTTRFDPRPLTLDVVGGQRTSPQNNASGGATADIVACLDNGDSTFTQVTLHFVNGMLQSVES